MNTPLPDDTISQAWACGTLLATFSRETAREGDMAPDNAADRAYFAYPTRWRGKPWPAGYVLSEPALPAL